MVFSVGNAVDIGSIQIPDTDIKIWNTASPGLRYALENRCSWDKKTRSSSSLNGQVDCLILQASSFPYRPVDILNVCSTPTRESTNWTVELMSMLGRRTARNALNTPAINDTPMTSTPELKSYIFAKIFSQVRHNDCLFNIILLRDLNFGNISVYFVPC